MRSSNHKLFEQIFDAHSAEIYKYVAFRLADRSLVEDIVSEVFTRFWKKMVDGVVIDNPRALLYTVAHGAIIDQYRIAQRRPVGEAIEILDAMKWEEIDVQAIDRRQDYAQVLEKMQQLDEGYREVILLHYVQQLTIPEIAKIIDEKENNVRVRLHRALEKLRQQLNTT
jgi:RNA polymerase sigma-70 factor, ECF subfamily